MPAKISINMRDYESLISDFKDNPSTITKLTKELDELIKHYSKHPFMKNKELVRTREIMLQSVKKKVILINEDIPEQEEYEEKKRQKELKIIEELYSDADLINYKPEPQSWLIENQIPKGEVGLLVGKRGERKTFIALYQALCLASGKKVFNIDDVSEKKKILIVDEETGKDNIAKRIFMLKKGLKIKEALNIKFLSFLGLKLDRRETETFLKFSKIVRDFQPDLIIIDCLQRCVTFEIDRDNTSISELFTEVIRPIIKAYGTSWLFVHHLRKSPTSNYRIEDPLDEVRGGSELVNYCRYVLMCQTPRGQQTNEGGSEFLIFRVLKMSNAPIPEPKVISFTSNDDNLKIAYEGLPEEILAGEVQAANRIKNWLFEKQLSCFKTADIIQAADEIGFKKNLLNNGLKFLLQQGFLNKPSRGSWGIVGSDKNQKKL